MLDKFKKIYLALESITPDWLLIPVMWLLFFLVELTGLGEFFIRFHVRIKVRGQKVRFVSYGPWSKDRKVGIVRLAQETLKRHSVPKGRYDVWVSTGDEHLTKKRTFGVFHSYDFTGSSPQYPCFSFWDRLEFDLDFERTSMELADRGLQPPQFNKVFWIGNKLMHSSRSKVLEIAQRRSDLFDARHNHPLHKASFVPMPEQCNWSVLLDIRGIGYSGRRKYLMYSRRPLLIVDDPFSEFWQHGMKPMAHYVPVKSDLSDLVDQAEMLLGDKQLRREIANNAFEYAQKYVTQDAAYRQIVKVFEHAHDRKKSSLMRRLFRLP